MFDLLDQKLYGEDARSDEEVRRDVQRFARFAFLTNGGESFDRSKSFLVRRTSAEALIVFVDDRTGFHAGTVDWMVFEERVRAFLRWLESQRICG
ncbi:MAG: hypothetical protein KC464_27570 [Myxococcales bacterium]|nr:hypothetical protein [Myxococcales bacterium]